MKIPEGVKYIIGIDEAGRGPLAGPVAVGVCLVSANMTRKSLLAHGAKSQNQKSLPLRDSKKLSENMREMWFAKMREMKKGFNENSSAHALDFSVTLISNKIIDDRGLSFAIRKAMSDSLKKLQQSALRQAAGWSPSECLVLLDGGLHAPATFPFQKTIIKGDEKEFAISLASIAAKVTRDTHMKKLAKKYPAYGFEIHKGYGTRRHITAIKKNGISAVHRRTFLSRVLVDKSK